MSEFEKALEWAKAIKEAPSRSMQKRLLIMHEVEIASALLEARERIGKLEKERDQLRAECERLKGEWTKECDRSGEQWNQLRARVGELEGVVTARDNSIELYIARIAELEQSNGALNKENDAWNEWVRKLEGELKVKDEALKFVADKALAALDAAERKATT